MYGAPARRKVKVVQKQVNVAAVKKVTKQACTSTGSLKSISRIDQRILK